MENIEVLARESQVIIRTDFDNNSLKEILKRLVNVQLNAVSPTEKLQECLKVLEIPGQYELQRICESMNNSFDQFRVCITDVTEWTPETAKAAVLKGRNSAARTLRDNRKDVDELIVKLSQEVSTFNFSYL